MILNKIADAILKISGWKIEGSVPALDKAVYIAAPHTSNWDGFWLIVAKIAFGLEAKFLAKHTLFWWPLGAILARLGAIPIDRSRGAGIVGELIERFRQNDRLALALAPEGTRRWMPYWKTGFYRVAVGAEVPIVLGFIDYGSKKMGIGGTYEPTGDQEKDLDYLRKFYSRFTPCRPENMGPVAFPPGN
ncbi:MAG: lysophospholipid acyltransferase family protein [Woeseia sp.]